MFSDKVCPEDFTNLENGEVTCTDGVKYLSQCLFQCSPGYQLLEPYDEHDRTSIILTCRSDAKWSIDKKPRCEKITCDPNMQYLDDVSFSTLTFSSSKYM